MSGVRWSEMVLQAEDDLLTIAEAAKLLKVSRVTLHRWLKAGRLPAYHVGPKGVRIRRADLAAFVQPAQPARGATGEGAAADYLAEALRPLTEEEKRQALEAAKAAEEFSQELLARRGGQLFDESWPMINESRDERSRQLLQ